jgi:hypothetical protein
MNTFRLLAIAAVLVLVPATAPAAAGAKVKVGPHFRVICHFEDDDVAAAALETVEAIWPAASDLYGLPPTPLDAPLNVHLFRRAADYLAEERNLADGNFDKNLAFWSFDTRSAYVAVQPDVTDETLAAIGLTAQTRHLLAHEAAHLVRDLASPAARVHPNWLCDGAAIWIEEKTLAARGWSAGDEDPFVARDMILAQGRLAGGALPSATQILRDETKDLGMYERYAVRKLLFRRLITRKDAPAFRTALAKALRIEPGPDFAKQFFDAVTAPYATEGLDGLDLDFEQFVRSQTPAWDEVHRSLATAGDAWAQTAFADQNAIAWRTASVGADAYEVRGQIEILPGLGKANQMNLLLGRDKATGFVSVAFVAGYGADVFFYDSRDDKWLRLASGPTKGVALWRRVPFRVVVAGDRLTVAVDGVEVAAAELKGHAMTGAWGLGVQAGGVGVWRGVKVETTTKR